jgi:hypothetical protein
VSDLTGMVFGNRTVLAKAGHASTREWNYLCRCSCGREDIIRGNALRKGKANKCKACSSSITKNRTTHGLSKSTIYNAWKGMMHRCYRSNTRQYSDYGGRGINVCDAWHEPTAFHEWASFNGWKPGLSIDRIDVNSGYRPDNCRWATTSEQTENVRLITKANVSGYRGVSKKHGRDVWLARITVDYKIIHLGHHATAIEAALAHDAYVVSNGLRRPLNFEARKLSGH